IYDGDTPDLDMWMVFNALWSKMLGEGTISCVTALDGQVAVGSGGSASYDLNIARFLEDTAHQYSTSSVANLWGGNIAQRNDTIGYYDNTALPNIISRDVRDVAMTVLPNAPIDSATGLPIPTIAVATDGGVSVIKDDGNVWDLTDGSRDFQSVSFNGDTLWTTHDQTGAGHSALAEWTTPISSLSSDSTSRNEYKLGVVPTILIDSGDYTGKVVPTNGIATAKGLTLLKENTTMANGSVAYITSDYNTGYMTGDIKGAWLSDTDTTSFPSADGMATYSLGGGATGGITNGVLDVTSSPTSNQCIVIPFSFTAGKWYELTTTAGTGCGSLAPYGLLTTSNAWANYVGLSGTI
ncbi:MAG: hypothetical protein QF535_05005, partial [Anaerolineales bacterium]|nr:hypothetical protein [Anaerolineales bacterium]